VQAAAAASQVRPNSGQKPYVNLKKSSDVEDLPADFPPKRTLFTRYKGTAEVSSSCVKAAVARVWLGTPGTHLLVRYHLLEDHQLQRAAIHELLHDATSQVCSHDPGLWLAVVNAVWLAVVCQHRLPST